MFECTIEHCLARRHVLPLRVSDQPVRANTGPLPRHRPPAEVRNIHDEEACCSACLNGVVSRSLFRETRFFCRFISRKVSWFHGPGLPNVPHCFECVRLRIFGGRYSEDCSCCSWNHKTQRGSFRPAELQPRSQGWSGFQDAGKFVSEDDRDPGCSVPGVLSVVRC